MRIGIFLLLLTTFINSTKRGLDGGYLNGDSVKEGYYFWSKTKEFSWFKMHNEIKEFGQGKYDLINDSVILNFGTARKQFDIEEVTKSIDRGKESIVVYFADENGNPIEGLEIKLEKAGLKGTTNKDGIAVINTAETSIYSDEIDFRIGNYRTYQQSVSLKRQEYKFIVIADKGRKYTEDKKLKFKINITGNGIEIIGDNKSSARFNRVTRDDFMDLYHGFKK